MALPMRPAPVVKIPLREGASLPGGADHGEGEPEGNARVGPRHRVDLREELAPGGWCHCSHLYILKEPHLASLVMSLQNSSNDISPFPSPSAWAMIFR